MKLVSWNVNGIRAAIKHGFEDVFKELDADIFCINETKLSAGQLDLNFPGYESYWNYAERKGYSGTERLFRNGRFYEEEAVKCSKWNWNR